MPDPNDIFFGFDSIPDLAQESIFVDPEVLEFLIAMLSSPNKNYVYISRPHIAFGSGYDDSLSLENACQIARRNSEVLTRDLFIQQVADSIDVNYRKGDFRNVCSLASAYSPFLNEQEENLLIEGIGTERFTTRLQRAVIFGRDDLLRKFVSEGDRIEEVDLFGNSLPQIAAKSTHLFRLRDIHNFLDELGADFNIPDSLGRTYSHNILLFKIPDSYTLFLKNNEWWNSLPPKVQDSLGKALEFTGYPQDIQKCQRILVDSSLTEKECALLLAAKIDALAGFSYSSGNFLTHLRPHLTEEKNKDVMNILYSIASSPVRTDNYNTHPNEPEFLSLIDDSSEESLAATAPLARRLEVRNGSYGNTIKTKAWQSENYASIGRLTFSHVKYTFDARSVRNTEGEIVAPALFENYGFERITDRESDFKIDEAGERIHHYGPGFKLSNDRKSKIVYKAYSEDGEQFESTLDMSSYVECRRAYYVFCDPIFGTLLVENSSPFFGRGTLGSSCLLSSKEHKEEDLKNLSAAMIERDFDPLLQIYGYANHNLYNNTHFLLRNLRLGLEAVLSDYERAKCDTSDETAWVNGKLVGGYRSPLFKDLVNYLFVANFERAMGNDKIIVPNLALMDRKNPMKPLYPFQSGYGETLYSLPVTVDMLNGLQDLLHTDGPQTVLLEKLGLRSFFEQAFYHQANLVLINPNTVGGIPNASN